MTASARMTVVRTETVIKKHGKFLFKREDIK